MAHPTPTSTEPITTNPLTKRVLLMRYGIILALNVIPALVTATLAVLIVAAISSPGMYPSGIWGGSFAASFGAYGLLAIPLIR